MFEAAQAYLNQTDDWSFVENKHSRESSSGTSEERALASKSRPMGSCMEGEAGSQLTWMDAKAGDVVATPHQGKPVELQELWYNALLIMEQAARKFGSVSKAGSYATMADLARRSFNDAFWFGAGGYLYDVIDRERRDASLLRPNQILTVSLSLSMLDSARARAVVEAVERELLTPRGLRSLAPSDPRYRGRLRWRRRHAG
jgi:predicted glycogen debranching enzyme